MTVGGRFCSAAAASQALRPPTRPTVLHVFHDENRLLHSLEVLQGQVIEVKGMVKPAVGIEPQQAAAASDDARHDTIRSLHEDACHQGDVDQPKSCDALDVEPRNAF